MTKIGRRLSGALTAGAVLLVAAAAPLGAMQDRQERPERQERECQCVDRDGNPIERCTCFVTPDFRGIARGFVYTAAPIRLGVTVSQAQDAALDRRGALLQDVMDDSPADEAGLREGDVVTRLDGHSLLEPLDRETERDFDPDESIPVQRFRAIARELDTDVDVEVAYERDGETHTATVHTRDVRLRGGLATLNFDASGLARGLGELGGRLGELQGNAFRLEGPGMGHGVTVWSRPGETGTYTWRGLGETARAARRFDACPGTDSARPFGLSGRCVGGLEMVPLNPELGEYFGTVDGVLVTDVHEDSPIGLQPGDVIVGVGDRAADSPDRVRRILDSYTSDEDVTFRIFRNRTEMQVSGRLGG